MYWHFLPKRIIERGRIFKAASHKSDDSLRTFALDRPPEGYRLVDTRLPREDILDISRIDSIASDFDLMIDSTHEGEVAPVQAFDEISRAIIRLGPPSFIGVVEEAGAGACRITPVAGERLRSGHTQFANISRGDRTKLMVDNYMIKP